MDLDTRNIEANTFEWSIPWWVKTAISFFSVSAGAVFILSLVSAQERLLGLPVDLILTLAAALVFLLTLVAISFWAFPGSALAVFLYWLIRALRELICVFALLGVIYLITIRTPVLSLRGGIPLANLLVLLSLALFVHPLRPNQFPLAWMKSFSLLIEKQIHRINALPAWILSLAIALLPILVVCATIYLGLHSSLERYGPYSFWNDETGYWLWTRSFSHVGFSAGYNAPNELIAPAAFNRFGEGSPFYIYLYGTIARLIGWAPHIPILINFFLLALAIFAFTYFTKLEPVQTLFIGLIVITTWPILLYLPLTTHETLNQSIGFILSIVFFRLLSQPDAVCLSAKISFVVLIYLATLIRLSWGLLLIPAIFYALNGNTARRLFLSVIVGLSLYASAILITSYLVPPVNNSITAVIRESLARGPRAFFEHISFQLFLMFRFRELNPNIAVLFQIGIIIIWSLVRLIHLIRQRLSTVSILQSQSAFDIYNMGTLASAGLFLYLQEGFYRTFAPAMLIVYLLHVERKDYRFLTALLAINIVFFYSYMTFYAKVGDFEIIRSDFTTPFVERDQLQAKLGEQIVFDPGAQNPWCNTLLIPLNYYDYRLTVLPPGIGVSYVLDAKSLEMPVKSHYLLLDQKTYEILAAGTRMEPAGAFSIGDLYYNLDSGCKVNP